MRTSPSWRILLLQLVVVVLSLSTSNQPLFGVAFVLAPSSRGGLARGAARQQRQWLYIGSNEDEQGMMTMTMTTEKGRSRPPTSPLPKETEQEPTLSRKQRKQKKKKKNMKHQQQQQQQQQLPMQMQQSSRPSKQPVNKKEEEKEPCKVRDKDSSVLQDLTREWRALHHAGSVSASMMDDLHQQAQEYQGLMLDHNRLDDLKENKNTTTATTHELFVMDPCLRPPTTTPLPLVTCFLDGQQGAPPQTPSSLVVTPSMAMPSHTANVRFGSLFLRGVDERPSPLWLSAMNSLESDLVNRDGNDRNDENKNNQNNNRPNNRPNNNKQNNNDNNKPWNELPLKEKRRLVQEAQSNFCQIVTRELDDRQSALVRGDWKRLPYKDRRRLVQEAQSNFCQLLTRALDDRQQSLVLFETLPEAFEDVDLDLNDRPRDLWWNNVDNWFRMDQEEEDATINTTATQEPFTEELNKEEEVVEKPIVLLAPTTDAVIEKEEINDIFSESEEKTEIDQTVTANETKTENKIDDEDEKNIFEPAQSMKERKEGEVNKPDSDKETTDEERARLIQQARETFEQVAQKGLDERQQALLQDASFQSLNDEDQVRLVTEAQDIFESRLEADLNDFQKSLLDSTIPAPNTELEKQRLIEEAKENFEKQIEADLNDFQKSLLDLDISTPSTEEEKQSLIDEARESFRQRVQDDLNDFQKSLLDSKIPVPSTIEEKQSLIEKASEDFRKRLEADLDEDQKALLQAPIPAEDLLPEDRQRLVDQAKSDFTQQTQSDLNLRQQALMDSSKPRLILQAQQVFQERLQADLNDFQKALANHTVAVPQSEEERARLIASAQATFQKRAEADLDQRQKSLLNTSTTDLVALGQEVKDRLVREAQETFGKILEDDLDQRQQSLVASDLDSKEKTRLMEEAKESFEENLGSDLDDRQKDLLDEDNTSVSSAAFLSQAWASRNRLEDQQDSSTVSFANARPAKPARPSIQMNANQNIATVLSTEAIQELTKAWIEMNIASVEVEHPNDSIVLPVESIVDESSEAENDEKRAGAFLDEPENQQIEQEAQPTLEEKEMTSKDEIPSDHSIKQPIEQSTMARPSMADLAREWASMHMTRDDKTFASPSFPESKTYASPPTNDIAKPKTRSTYSNNIGLQVKNFSFEAKPRKASTPNNVEELTKQWRAMNADRHTEMPRDSTTTSFSKAIPVTPSAPIPKTPLKVPTKNDGSDLAKQWAKMNESPKDVNANNRLFADFYENVAHKKPFQARGHVPPKAKTVAELAKEWKFMNRDPVNEFKPLDLSSFYKAPAKTPAAKAMEASIGAPGTPTAAEVAKEWLKMHQEEQKVDSSGTGVAPTANQESVETLAKEWAQRNKVKDDFLQTPSFIKAQPIFAEDLVKPMSGNRVGAPSSKKDEPQVEPPTFTTTPEDFILPSGTSAAIVSDSVSETDDDVIFMTSLEKETSAASAAFGSEPISFADTEAIQDMMESSGTESVLESDQAVSDQLANDSKKKKIVDSFGTIAQSSEIEATAKTTETKFSVDENKKIENDKDMAEATKLDQLGISDDALKADMGSSASYLSSLTGKEQTKSINQVEENQYLETVDKNDISSFGSSEQHEKLSVEENKELKESTESSNAFIESPKQDEEQSIATGQSSETNNALNQSCENDSTTNDSGAASKSKENVQQQEEEEEKPPEIADAQRTEISEQEPVGSSSLEKSALLLKNPLKLIPMNIFQEKQEIKDLIAAMKDAFLTSQEFPSDGSKNDNDENEDGDDPDSIVGGGPSETSSDEVVDENGDENTDEDEPEESDDPDEEGDTISEEEESIAASSRNQTTPDDSQELQEADGENDDEASKIDRKSLVLGALASFTVALVGSNLFESDEDDS